MHTFIFFIVICAGFHLISANISSATIESDLDEIMKLSKDVKQYSPQIAYQVAKTTCQMISQCCPQIQSKFMSMSLSGKTAELTEQCFGSTGSSKHLSNLFACSPLMKLTTMIHNEQFIKYWSIIQNETSHSKEDAKLILDSCTNEEISSIACDWNNFDLEKTCQRRILETLAKQGDEIYQNKVQQQKERDTKLVNELKKEFNN